MDDQAIIQKLDNIEQLLANEKRILNTEDLAFFTGFSKSTIYKMVAKNILPFSKPNGKDLFFERKKIEDWLLSRPNRTKNEIMADAQRFVHRSR